MIYFLQPVGGGPVKIGCSEDVDRRHAELETYYARPLVLLGTMPGDRDREAEIHKQFAETRLGRTEQFQPTFELMNFIGRPLLACVNPDAVEAMEPHPGVTTVAICIKGTPEWKAWLDEFAEFCGLGIADLIGQAAIAFAEKHGFERPPNRMPRSSQKKGKKA